MDEDKFKTVFTNDVQFYLRLISVFIGVLLNAYWYRTKFPKIKNVFLIILVALFVGLYW